MLRARWCARAAGVVGFDAGTDPRRLEPTTEQDELATLTLVRDEITDLAALEREVDEHEITNVLQLAAPQVPFARADLSLRLNQALGATSAGRPARPRSS